MNDNNSDSNPKTSPIVLAGIVGIVLVLVVIVLTIAMFRDVKQREMTRKIQAMENSDFQALRAEQQEMLQQYRWIDQQSGVAGIPISRAMSLVVYESGGEVKQ